MINVEEKKAKIIELINSKGPMLPIQVARGIELSTLFASAIMSEMISEKSIKTSNLKVGGSPLYYLSGQENMLENFINYLGGKEKEVFMLLKRKGVLEDEKLEPAHRVAIRDIKDFAIPLQVRIDDKEKIFWRFLSFPIEEAIRQIRDMTRTKSPERKQEKFADEGTKQKIYERKEESEKKTAEKPDEFIKSVYHYIEKEKIRVIEEIEKKRKEMLGKVMINSSIGEIIMLLVAKDKKTITENDLHLALSRGQSMRLPVLFLSSGKLNKRASSEIETFKSYLIFRQITN
jgi:hypothetical protein